MTEWRIIPSFPKYLVSEDGHVRHRNSDKPRKLQPLKKYLCVNFWHDRKFRVVPVHALVADAFIGPRPNGLDVRHLDGNPKNNHFRNLAYGTRAENAADRERHGRTARGDRSGTTKLSDANVDFVRLIYASGKASQHELAALFGISQAQINNIILRKQRQKAA